MSHPDRFGVEVIRDKNYTHTNRFKGAHLDVYRPKERHGKLPRFFLFMAVAFDSL